MGPIENMHWIGTPARVKYAEGFAEKG